MNQPFPGVFHDGKRFLTKNLVPGTRSYGEEIVQDHGNEFRVWDPYRSKPAAALTKGLKNFPVQPGMTVLYLGAANGNTVSFFSDIIGPKGVVYAVEISERPMRDLLPVAEKRGNIVPILANARVPKEYFWIEPADLVYQDVAVRDQAEILARNCDAFLKPNGLAALAIKARSIDVVANPKEVVAAEVKRLSQGFKIAESLQLDPYEKDHEFVVMAPKR
ncbi:MAG: fibrillarin-like rRNA/tRNA 2'-O-methyltransferase [Candidatus Aenigmatarchaeota archaeon]